jgi:type VI secretion system protein ImpM
MPEPPVSPPSADDGLGPTVILPAQEGTQPATPAGTRPPTPPALQPALQPMAQPAAQPSAPPPAAAEAVACWFGKLPFLGDFASRRLPESFIRPWDEWLQPSLAAVKDATGDRWLDLYLTFPVWRFVMPAGLLDQTNWIGVLLPSVDRVGRCFPLTICEPLARTTLEEAGLIGIDLRLAALADVGIEALDADSVDFLEQRLAGLGTLRAANEAAATGTPIPLEAWLQRARPGELPSPAAWPLCGTVPAILASAASRFAVAALRDRVLWWSPADEAGGTGAMLLEPFPFPQDLLSRLIGTH